MELGGGGWSWVEVGAGFSNTHLISCNSFRYVKMCLLEVASEKCRSSHFAVGGGGGSNKFEDWVGIKNLALLHFYTLPYPTLSLLMTLNEET